MVDLETMTANQLYSEGMKRRSLFQALKSLVKILRRHCTVLPMPKLTVVNATMRPFVAIVGTLLGTAGREPSAEADVFIQSEPVVAIPEFERPHD